MPILLDFESRSRADLKRIGGRLYWEHPSTEVLCCCWHDTDSGMSGTWVPGMPSPDVRGRVLAAHNMTGFDRYACVRLGWLAPGDMSWIDTAELARVQGMPGSLEALGEIYGVSKDTAASRYTLSLSSVRRPREVSADDWRIMPDDERRRIGVLPVPDIQRVISYCQQDVAILVRAWPDLREWSSLEPDVARVDRAVNDRGVCFDVGLARALIRSVDAHTRDVCASVALATGMTPDAVLSTVMSPAQFAAATGAPNAQSATVDAMVAAGPDAPGYQLALARRASTSIVRGKLTAGLARVSPDGRMRDTMRYYGAHTGRWSSRGMQLQNLTRPHPRYEDWTSEQIDALARDISSGSRLATPDETDLLLRACICAAPGRTLVVRDYSGIEARGLAWAARDDDYMQMLTSDRDPYRVMGAQIFGIAYEATTKVHRQCGKIGILGCGYRMGADALGDFAGGMGINLAALGVEPRKIVDGFRRARPKVVQHWVDLEQAFFRAIAGEDSTVTCFDFRSDGHDVAVILPSGRPIVYRQCTAAVESTRWGRRPMIRYAHALGKTIVQKPLHGGVVEENIIQGLCRDLLSDALVRSEDAGLDPVLTVHDEIGCEVDDELVADAIPVIDEIMTTPPSWAAGFVLHSAGFEGKRYRK